MRKCARCSTQWLLKWFPSLRSSLQGQASLSRAMRQRNSLGSPSTKALAPTISRRRFSSPQMRLLMPSPLAHLDSLWTHKLHCSSRTGAFSSFNRDWSGGNRVSSSLLPTLTPMKLSTSSPVQTSNPPKQSMSGGLPSAIQPRVEYGPRFLPPLCIDQWYTPIRQRVLCWCHRP